MTTDNKTLADVQPGGRVRLGDGVRCNKCKDRGYVDVDVDVDDSGSSIGNVEACPHCALAARQPVGEPVAYLDLGAGGYMDLGTDLSDEEMAALPKGRHMLAIIGTYGVDGYKPAQAVDLGQIWQRAFNDTAHSYRRNKSRMWVLQMLKERVQALIDSQAVGNG
ncbi:TPA: hypothetical protein ACOENT_000075 [Stenotrophomonas maltophilia]